MNESLLEFLRKTASKTSVGRWCVAAPLQADAFKKMPDAVRTIKDVKRQFRPERVRVCILSPDRHGAAQEEKKLQRLFQRLWRLGRVECHCIDARERTANGSLLADFLDYT
jgi:hypothetical protein